MTERSGRRTKTTAITHSTNKKNVQPIKAPASARTRRSPAATTQPPRSKKVSTESILGPQKRSHAFAATMQAPIDMDDDGHLTPFCPSLKRNRQIIDSDDDELNNNKDSAPEDNDDLIYGGIDGAAIDALPNELARFNDPSLNDLEPTSESEFRTLGQDSEEESDSSQLKRPPPKRIRTKTWHDEAPRWKEEVGDDETAMLDVRSEAGLKDLGHRALSVSSKFPDAPYVCPGAGQTMGLSDQPAKLRSLLTYTVRQVNRHAISINIYIPMGQTQSTMAKLFMRTAVALGQNAYSERIAEDLTFRKDISGLLSNRLSGFRSKIKNKVSVGLVRGWYHLDGPDSATKAADLITQEKYIFPSSPAAPDSLNKTRPFFHPAIISILRDEFFTGERSLAEKHHDCFSSSVPEHPTELEVTAPMAAFAAVCVHAALDQIKLGENGDTKRRRAAFSADQYEGVYQTHIEYITYIRNASIKKYHRLMSDLFSEVSAGTSINRSKSQGKAAIDIDGMPE